MYFLHYTPCIEIKNIMLREFLAADVQRIIGIRPIRAVQGTGQCPAEKPRLARSLRKMGRTLTCPCATRRTSIYKGLATLLYKNVAVTANEMREGLSVSVCRHWHLTLCKLLQSETLWW